MKNTGRLIAAAAIMSLIAAAIYLDLHTWLTLETMQTERANLLERVAARPLVAALGFMAVYVLVTALSIPGAVVMTLSAGAVFGLLWGTVIVSFASTFGATCAMLVSRYVLRDFVQGRFANRLAGINAGVEREGAFYLFTLRLVPAVPFFLINLAMGVTRISVLRFFVVSQLGMFAGTVVYVNAGTHLAEIESTSDIMSPALIGSLVLLGIFPLIARRLVLLYKQRRLTAGYDKPSRFDRDLVVIGAGSGGLVAALIGATVKAKVTLIEQNLMGGDCLNTGCVPSKSLIRSAKFAADVERASSLGFKHAETDFDFKDIMARVARIIDGIAPHDSVERYRSLGVDVRVGRGEIRSPWCVAVDGHEITTRHIIVATGASPFVPPIPGLDDIHYLTSDNVWNLDEKPRRLVVLGGGPIGTEMTQAFARLGSDVTQVEMAPRLLVREDEEVGTLAKASLVRDGASVLTGHRALRVETRDGGEKCLIVADVDDDAGAEVAVPFDEILVAVGRRAAVSGFGLEALGIELTSTGTIAVDDFLATNIENIYAIGDVAGPYQFTHTASHMAWYAAVNALFGTFRRFRVDYSVIPWCTFSSPEVARVGINETDAIAAATPHEVTTYDVGELDRARADEAAEGFVKVITANGSDRILGVTVVADHAGDVISEYVLAMKHGIGLNKILGTIHIYPTFAEMNKFAASEWRRAHKPDWLLDIAERYHTLRRG
jgi:pyruvate/2-oxoglutarate dehydrogenase complex dihydrolipoamide dehydrogenase (E3) component/uncharacterized membrane protein YdjX (TVP38/TMEM64 family)